MKGHRRGKRLGSEDGCRGVRRGVERNRVFQVPRRSIRVGIGFHGWRRRLGHECIARNGQRLRKTDAGREDVLRHLKVNQLVHQGVKFKRSDRHTLRASPEPFAPGEQKVGSEDIPLNRRSVARSRHSVSEGEGLVNGPNEGSIDGTPVIRLLGTLGTDVCRKERIQTMEMRRGTSTHQVHCLSSEENRGGEG